MKTGFVLKELKLGTTFDFKSMKVGNEEFENWLLHSMGRLQALKSRYFSQITIMFVIQGLRKIFYDKLFL